MLFSYCVPIRNRAADFNNALPTVLAAARKSPPVEIVVLDYGSTDCLASYLAPYYGEIKYRFHDAPFFHMARARNLVMAMGRGQYLISSNADTLLDESYFEVVRELVERTRCDVARAGPRINGVLVVKRGEFFKAGGFDERFEFYGPEDKDLVARLTRRGLKMAYYDPALISYIPTPNNVKVQGYRLPLSKREMAKRMHPIFEQNETDGRLTANDA